MADAAIKPSESLTLIESDKPKKAKVFEEIKARQTDELVIAFCGPLGSGVSTVAKEFEKKIRSYTYGTHYLKVSNLIRQHIDLVPGHPPIPTSDNPAEVIEALQDAGNALRRKYGNDILSQFAINEIAIKREDLEKSENAKKVEGIEKAAEVKEEDSTVKSKPRRHVTVIDSIKHPEEVGLLKAVYGNMFYLFAILCPEQIRKHRLNEHKDIPDGQEVALMKRDKSESEGFGQQLLDTLHYADFYIRNADVNVTLLQDSVKRYIDLILGDQFITPSTDEYAMYCAQSAALKSSCLSRQVGAAIMSEDGELISTGCNDVPKCGGGYYSERDKENDGRCMKLYGQQCKNQEFKDKIIQAIENALLPYLSDVTKRTEAMDKIKEIERLKNILEFSRSVHAEMDAIVNIARLGNASLRNAALYCTTFPCHHCSRHIVASGITKVYYIEPYEKSLARQLHNDAIDFDPKVNGSPGNKVIFIPFEGVAPRQYMNLFKAGERKVGGKKVEQDLTQSKPRVVQLLDTHVDYETKVVKHVKLIIQNKT